MFVKRLSNPSFPLALGLTLGLAAFLLAVVMLTLTPLPRVVSAHGPGIFSQRGSGDTTGMFIPDMELTGNAAATASSSLAISKDVTPTHDVAYGGMVTYTVTLQNSDPVSNTPILFTDTLPVGATFDGWIVQPAGVRVADDEITWSGELTASTMLTFTFTALHTGDYGEVLTNTAVFSAATQTGAASAAFTVVGAPALGMVKTVTPTEFVDLSDLITYTLSISNSGGSPAAGIGLTDTLPVSLTFGGFVENAVGAGEAGGVITWNAERLPAGTTVALVYTATVNADYGLYGQTLTNTAVLTSANAGAGLAEAAFTLMARPELALAKSVTPTSGVDVGEAVTYTLTLTHTGGGVARGVGLTDTLPASLTFGGFVENAVGAEAAAGVITWSAERLPAGTTVNLVYTATVNAEYTLYGQTITNKAVLSAQNVEGEMVDTATLTVAPAPVLQIRKSVETSDDYVNPGEVVTYTITLTNTGWVRTLGIVLTDTLPADLAFGHFVVNSGDASQDNGVISWKGSLGANGIVKIVYTATLQNAHGQVVINRVSFSSLNDGAGAAEANFRARAFVYLPLTLREFSTVPYWKQLPSLPQAASDGMAFVLGETLYHAGGWRGIATERIDAVYAFQDGSGWRSMTTTLPTARFGSAAAVVGERAYIIGGYDGNLLKRVDSFNGVNWRSEHSMKQTLNYPTAAARGNYLYVTGGLPGPTSEVWSAVAGDLLGDWNSQHQLNEGLITRMAASERCLYVVGGRDGNFAIHNEIYRAAFDEAGNIIKWSQDKKLPLPLVWHAVAIDQNRLYVAGGETSGGALNDQLYWIDISPVSCELQGSWQSLRMPGGGVRRMAWAVASDGLYLVGGQTNAGYTDQVWKLVFPTAN